MLEMKLGRLILLFLIAVLIISAAFLFSRESDIIERKFLAESSNSLFIDQKTGIEKETPELALIQNNSISGISCSQIFSSKTLGSLIEGGEVIEERKEILEYKVEEGDTLSSIADKFEISLNTLLLANDLSSRSVISPGQKLIVLPVSGALHHVRKGETLSGIAQSYKAETEDIVSFNELSDEGQIYVGDILIIPGGTKPVYTSAVASTETIPVASTYFIAPIASPYKITQGLHWYNAIDFANPGGSCGKPVFAAAGGEVLKIKYGYNGGAGNYIRVLHPNNLITHYGHLQTIFVSPGETVSQGDIIGLIGCTGKTIPAGSAGCHLHFALYSAQGEPPTNPFSR